MILQFSDGQEIDVIAIFGRPRMINGCKRDVLSIEIDPNTMLIGHLETFFKTAQKDVLYSIDDDGHRLKIGEGYNFLLAVRSENRLIDQMPGSMNPPEYEDIHIVELAQLNTEEYEAYVHGEWQPPEIISNDDQLDHIYWEDKIEIISDETILSYINESFTNAIETSDQTPIVLTP